MLFPAVAPAKKSKNARPSLSISQLNLSPPNNMSEPYIGEIKAISFNYPPRGYAYANGAILPIGQYNALFALVGTTFGGDGKSTFGIPNLQSRVPIGATTNTATLGGLTFHAWGAKGGAETVTLANSQMPMHNHQAVVTTPGGYQVTIGGTATATGTATGTGNATGNISIPAQNSGAATNIPGPTVVIGKPGAAAFANASNTNLLPFSATLPTTVSVPISAPVDLSKVTATASATTAPAIAVGNAGGSQPFGILPPFLAINYIIALEGIFPPRN